MIEQLQGFPAGAVGFVCKGHVTAEDYKTVLVPAVEKALETPGKVRLYYQVDTDFTGFDPGAAWQDFMVGMEHLLRWERIAVVTDIVWISQSIRAFGFLMPAAVQTFSLDEAAEARKWLTADGAE